MELTCEAADLFAEVRVLPLEIVILALRLAVFGLIAGGIVGCDVGLFAEVGHLMLKSVDRVGLLREGSLHPLGFDLLDLVLPRDLLVRVAQPIHLFPENVNPFIAHAGPMAGVAPAAAAAAVGALAALVAAGTADEDRITSAVGPDKDSIAGHAS